VIARKAIKGGLTRPSVELVPALEPYRQHFSCQPVRYFHISVAGDWKRPMNLHHAAAFAFLCLVLQLAASPSRAEDQDGRSACVTDAVTVCGQFIPDRDRVAHCLLASQSRISPACRTALKHFK
jgi:hypothetical protein